MSAVEVLRERASACIDAGRGLDFAAYTDPEIFELEKERIFRRDWVAVCAEGELSAPGDYVALTIADQPIFVMRGRDACLRALSNVCRHRGTPLLDAGRGRARNITCPYHAWSYADDGALLNAPFAKEGEVDPAQHKLPGLPLEVWAGVVFVCLDANVRPLRERVAGAVRHLDRWGLDRYDTIASPYAPSVWESNWKLAFENGIEGYHLFQVHPQSFEQMTPTRGTYYVEGSADWAVVGGRATTDSEPHPSEPAGIGLFERTNYALISLPPSFVGLLSRESWIWIAVLPESPERCKVTGGCLQPKALADPSAYMEFANVFLSEDRGICERAQRGMRSGLSTSGSLIDMERDVADFHRFLAWRLFDRAPDPPHRREVPPADAGSGPF